MKYFILFLFIGSIVTAQDLFKKSTNYDIYQSFLSSQNSYTIKSLDSAAERYKEIFSIGNSAENDSSAELFYEKYVAVVSDLNGVMNREAENNLNIQSIYDFDLNYEGESNGAIKEKGLSLKDLEFIKILKKYSLKLDMTEGLIYVNFADEKYFYKIVGNYISEQAIKYFSKLINESAKEAFKDAAIVVPLEELADRMVNWEIMYNSDLHSKAKQIAKERFSIYFGILFGGTDNTPAFTFEKNKLVKDFENVYKYIVKKHRCSVTAKIFDDYLNILKKNGNRNTKRVDKFIERKINSIDEILDSKK